MTTTRRPNRQGAAGRRPVARRSGRKLSATQTAIVTAGIGAVATVIAAALGVFGKPDAAQATRQPPSTPTISPSTSGALPSTKATAPLTPGDNSAFITDVTYPDGSTVIEGQRFTKKWEIKNTGTVLWVGRYLTPAGPSTGLCSYPERVNIPVTHPGKDAIISVPVTASTSPGVCFVTWKMVTASGILYFPNEIGIWFNVKVIS
jgi:hypothetical protein